MILNCSKNNEIAPNKLMNKKNSLFAQIWHILNWMHHLCPLHNKDKTKARRVLHISGIKKDGITAKSQLDLVWSAHPGWEGAAGSSQNRLDHGIDHRINAKMGEKNCAAHFSPLSNSLFSKNKEINCVGLICKKEKMAAIGFVKEREKCTLYEAKLKTLIYNACLFYPPVQWDRQEFYAFN